MVRRSKIETKLQEHLNTNVLFSLIHSCFERIKDHIGQKTSKYSRIHTIFYPLHSNCLRLYHRSWLICSVKKCLRNGKETVPRLHAFISTTGIAANLVVYDVDQPDISEILKQKFDEWWNMANLSNS